MSVATQEFWGFGADTHTITLLRLELRALADAGRWDEFDGVRRVLADALEDNGSVEAEFVRHAWATWPLGSFDGDVQFWVVPRPTWELAITEKQRRSLLAALNSFPLMHFRAGTLRYLGTGEAYLFEEFKTWKPCKWRMDTKAAPAGFLSLFNNYCKPSRTPLYY